MRDKGITDFFMCAESFKDINFHIVGGGGNYDIINETKKRNLPNVTLHGSLSHDKLSEILKWEKLNSGISFGFLVVPMTHLAKLSCISQMKNWDFQRKIYFFTK